MSGSDPIVLRLGHSPDPDDAFMWWPLLALGDDGPRIDTGRYRFEAIAQDIEALNERSEVGDLEITAMSCAQYPRVHDRYAITACGASLGDGYGPKLVARERVELEALGGGTLTIAVPGTRTSAFGALSLILGPGTFPYCVVPFDALIEHVATGASDAGLVIHEGQLTFEESGLVLLADVGSWWWDRTGLPLPLGVNAIRRDLEVDHGPGTLAEVTGLLRRSVEYALAHRAESIEYALGFARGMERALADRFIAMYVNGWTLDFGETGRRAVDTFVSQLAEAGLVPARDGVDFVSASD